MKNLSIFLAKSIIPNSAAEKVKRNKKLQWYMQIQ